MKKADKYYKQIKYQALILEIAEKALNGEVICVNTLAKKYDVSIQKVLEVCLVVRDLLNAEGIAILSMY